MKTRRVKGRLFTIAMIESAIEVAKKHYLVELTIDQMILVIASCDTFARDLRASGVCTDTATRDYLAHAMIRVLLKDNRIWWPVNADGEEYCKEFYSRFFQAAKDAGWKVLIPEEKAV